LPHPIHVHTIYAADDRPTTDALVECRTAELAADADHVTSSMTSRGG